MRYALGPDEQVHTAASGYMHPGCLQLDATALLYPPSFPGHSWGFSHSGSLAVMVLFQIQGRQ